ncbi:MAG: SH3 domain-containing protein [Clostridia bacterium]|nr:SH3 domain-containing protein [Clostridia bacterium]
MKRFFALMLIVALLMTGTALAAGYHRDELTFDYDKKAFDITMDDHTDTEDLVILTGKSKAWGNAYMRIHLRSLDEGEAFPTVADFKDMPEEVTQGEWNGFEDVIMYTVDDDAFTESYYIAPVTLDDNAPALLTVRIGVDRLDDEETSMKRDDAISAVADSLIIGAAVQATGSVHIRKGPGLDHDELGTVQKGTTLKYLDATETDERGVDWYKVEYEDAEAWVSSKYSKVME